MSRRRSGPTRAHRARGARDGVARRLEQLASVLERFPALRLGIVELSALGVPMFLMMLDGAWAFTRQISGPPADSLPPAPSDYFRRQVRVSSFAYEMPARIVEQMGGTDLLMCCSDYPHSEGTVSPIADYTAFGLDRDAATAPAFFAGNVDFLLRR